VPLGGDNFPLNHQTGKADDPVQQRRILLDAFEAFERLWAPGQMICLRPTWELGQRLLEVAQDPPVALIPDPVP